ncbi:hypothetical protein COO60DRAFT_1552757 [Scenedesmus sp. NREL 46B-D3]|nr:hypothetical protein COO60DRAFT_1552757 [Scenedesmus sp. NREL 46B-D3]
MQLLFALALRHCMLLSSNALQSRAGIALLLSSANLVGQVCSLLLATLSYPAAFCWLRYPILLCLASAGLQSHHHGLQSDV